ncbi:PIN domain-containing protein [bacterium]|nr:PIN domain-containing protein [bacterium]
MVSKVFVDSNIVVYTMDDRSPAKRDRCVALLASLGREPRGVVSTQVLQETYSVATSKLGVAPLSAKRTVRSLTLLEVITVTPPLILDAVDCSVLNTISFWDALIVAAAASANCETLWTEDLNPGQVIMGVRVENPLVAE